MLFLIEVDDNHLHLHYDWDRGDSMDKFEGLKVDINPLDNTEIHLAQHRNSVTDQLYKFNEETEEMFREAAEQKHAEKQSEISHRENVERLLSEVVDNTSSIKLMVEILQSGNETQQEVLSIMQEILTIGTAIDSEEAESKYKEIMKKITEKVENIETAEKLLTMSKGIYHAGMAYFKVNNGG